MARSSHDNAHNTQYTGRSRNGFTTHYNWWKSSNVWIHTFHELSRPFHGVVTASGFFHFFRYQWECILLFEYSGIHPSPLMTNGFLFTNLHTPWDISTTIGILLDTSGMKTTVSLIFSQYFGIHPSPLGYMGKPAHPRLKWAHLQQIEHEPT